MITASAINTIRKFKIGFEVRRFNACNVLCAECVKNLLGFPIGPCKLFAYQSSFVIYPKKNSSHGYPIFFKDICRIDLCTKYFPSEYRPCAVDRRIGFDRPCIQIVLSPQFNNQTTIFSFVNDPSQYSDLDGIHNAQAAYNQFGEEIFGDFGVVLQDLHRCFHKVLD